MSTLPELAAEGAQDSSRVRPLMPVNERADFRSLDLQRMWALITTVAIVGLVVRIVLLTRFYLVPDADQSVLGLMARHILQGERPVFYWGQVYTGSGEAYLTAALFRVFGQSNLVLHLIPLSAGVLFTAVTVALAWRLYGPHVAGLTGVYLTFAPMFLIDWSLWAGSGYLEAMVLGTIALLLVLPTESDHDFNSFFRVPAAFLLLGLGIWTQPIAVYYAVAVLVALAGRARYAVRTPRSWPGLLTLIALGATAFCVGASPLLTYNLQHSGATIDYLTTRSTHLDVVTVFSRLVLWAGPVILGFMPPTTDQAYFLGFCLDHLVLYAVALFLILALLFRGLSLWRVVIARFTSIGRPDESADLPILVLAILVLGGYLGTGWGGEAWAGSQPRYLLPLYTAVPLVIRMAIPVMPRQWQWVVAWVAMAGLVGVNIFVNTTTFPRQDVSPLIAVLDAHGVRAVYGDYWLVYPLMFESKERIVGVAVNDDLSKGTLNNRYSPYLRAAARASDFAWIASTGSTRERSIRACLTSLHSRYSVYSWADQTIYDRPTGDAFPWWNGGRCKAVR